jgi:hypothetical protein
MSESVDDAIASIADAICRYFELHPDAADTALGIQQWWLPAPLLEEPLPFIEIALDRLVESGVVRRTEHGDGNVSYSSARQSRLQDSSRNES